MTSEHDRFPQFRERLATLPTTPGVYIMRDATGMIIYVGKAVNLRNRVRTYFGALTGQAPKVARMVSHVADFEYILTDTELEALILENQLIKKHKPHYNVRLKDDKTYPYIKVTVNEDWPRVLYTRRLEEDGARYFGPYANSGAAQSTLELLNKLFPYRTCDLVIDGKMPRPCLQYYMHRCLAPCVGIADRAAYEAAIDSVILVLEGKHQDVIDDLLVRMEEAAENLNFERAAYLRDQVRALEKLNEQQKVFSTTPSDEDVIAFARNNGDACVQVFFIRQGKLLGRENYVLEGTAEESPGQIMESFVAQFYEDAADIPPNLILQHDVSEAEIIESWLRQKRGDTVQISVPNAGEKHDLVEMVARNAVDCLDQMRMRWLSDEQKATAALSELQSALQLAAWPERIECYDISHTQGTATVASMVVFVHGTAAKKEYRRFEIKTVTNNDFAAMQEVLRRRFRRASKERAEQSAHPSTDEDLPGDQTPTEAVLADELSNAAAAEMLTAEDAAPSASDAAVLAATRNRAANWTGWAVLPDLVIIDGGKGQLGAAMEVMRELGLTDIPTVGLAKEREEIFTPGAPVGLMLPREGEALHLVQRIRDEAHRFAIGYHRKLRSKKAFKSKLDDIPGIGPRRKAALLRHFGSLSRIRAATVEELAAAPGMNRAAAQQLKSLLE